MRGLASAINEIKKADSILISGHVNPDGDSLGSLLAMGLGLESLGKKVYMISCDGVPERYRRLPSAAKITRKISHPVDLAIAVDTSNKDILGRNYDSFALASRVLEIDHHDFRRSFGDSCFIDNKAACVGELIYILLNRLKVKISNRIAQNLMTSIIVETNSFRLPSVRPFTFKVCTELIGKGINFYELVDTVFWSKRKESAILSGICLSRCKFLDGGRIAWSIIKKEDFSNNGGRDEDVDAVPDEMRAIKAVDVALLFREKDKSTLRVSMRSKNRINVASLAEQYGGGGHFDVAGCNIPNSHEAVEKVLGLARALLEKKPRISACP